MAEVTEQLSKRVEDAMKLTEGMSAIELSSYAKAMRDKFGITVAPVAVAGVAAPGAGGAAAEEAQDSFDVILADPPYSPEYAKNLYGTDADYPKPGQISREACRLLKPGGLFGLLHFQVPMTRRPMRLVRVYGITTGAGYAIRAWTLCRKEVAP